MLFVTPMSAVKAHCFFFLTFLWNEYDLSFCHQAKWVLWGHHTLDHVNLKCNVAMESTTQLWAAIELCLFFTLYLICRQQTVGFILILKKMSKFNGYDARSLFILLVKFSNGRCRSCADSSSERMTSVCSCLRVITLSKKKVVSCVSWV